MGWLPVLLSTIAAFLLYRAGYIMLAVFAVVVVIVDFWSWGIMHNYATDVAKKRLSYRGGFYDIAASEANAVPDWITWINLITSTIGIILLIAGIVIIIRLP